MNFRIFIALALWHVLYFSSVDAATYPKRDGGKPWETIEVTEEMKDINMLPMLPKPTNIPMDPMPVTKGKRRTKIPMNPTPVTNGMKPTKMPMCCIIYSPFVMATLL